MNGFKVFIASAISILASSTAIAGNLVTLDIPVSDFTAVSASTGIKVIYSTGPKKVVLEASEEIADRVIVKTEGTTLEARLDMTGVKEYKIGGENGYKITLKVSSPDTNKFKVASGAGISIPENIRRNELEFNCTSGGAIKLSSASADEIDIDISSGAAFSGENISCTELDIDITSGATINLSGISSKNVECDASSGCGVNLSGTTEFASYNATSAASIKARNLKARDVKAKATSVASIRCYASESIDAIQSNQGTIGYAGHPKNVTRSRNPIYKMAKYMTKI